MQETTMVDKPIKNKKTLFFATIFSVLSGKALFASEKSPDDISWIFLVVGLFGGLALFLYGMEKMSDGMKKTAGDKMRLILAALTKNRVLALLIGAFVTMIIQSSSATTIMLVSFVNVGLMRFAQSLGVILGADIGTTITAQLIAFKIAHYSLLMITVGFGMRIFGRNDNTRNIGDIILGFGLLFFGMQMMSDAMEPLRDFGGFINLMKNLENPLAGLLVGILVTALLQSSSAFAGLVIVLAQQGLITLEAGIPLIFGSNIGTCITAGIASMSASREAKRVALAHVCFKIAGVILFVFWIPDFANIIHAIAIKFGSGTARQIANAHTIFNVSLALIFLPFTAFFANFILKLLPDREEDKGIKPATFFINEKCLETPALAIDLARREISGMARLLERMLRAIIIPFVSDEKLISRAELPKEEARLLIKEIPKKDEFRPQLSIIQGLDMRENKIDFLEEKIEDYLVKIGRQELSDSQASEVYGMISIVTDMERIGDLIHRNMVPLIAKKHALETDFSDEGKEELMIYHGKVCRQIQLLKEAFAERSINKARKIMNEERIFLDLELKYRVQHLDRILHKRKESAETHEVHMELMDLLKQIIVYTSNIAKTFLENCARKK